MRNLKYDTNALIHDVETDSRTQRTDLGLPVGAWGGWWTAVWDEQRQTHVEWTDKALLCSTGSYTQYPVMNHNGKEDEKEGIYVCNHFSV